MKFAQVFGITLLVSTISAWSINGHLFAANIAQDTLLATSPDSFDQASDILKPLEEYNATLTYREGDHAFVECATFADDIKYHGGAWQSDFHFEAKLWTPESDTGDYTGQIKKHNLTYGMESIVQWLSIRDDGSDYLDSYIYDYIQNRLYPGLPDVAQSYALRMLIHYVGDMHQPFHTEA
jgi:hypothetical protein